MSGCKAPVNWKSDEYVGLRAKGYDAHVVLKWLVHDLLAPRSRSIDALKNIFIPLAHVA